MTKTAGLDLDALARAILDNNLYMVLATADAAGRPWATPVYYAHAGYREFIWVSRPDARHSRNLAAQPEASIVVFDSTVPINTGQAVYIECEARELPGDKRALEVYARRAQAHGSGEIPTGLRLYRATARAQYVLDDRDRRVPVTP